MNSPGFLSEHLIVLGRIDPYRTLQRKAVRRHCFSSDATNLLPRQNAEIPKEYTCAEPFRTAFLDAGSRLLALIIAMKYG